MYQELTQCCNSIILQKQTNKFIEKEDRFVVTRGGRGGEVKGLAEGKLDEGSQKITNFQL